MKEVPNVVPLDDLADELGVRCRRRSTAGGLALSLRSDGRGDSPGGVPLQLHLLQAVVVDAEVVGLFADDGVPDLGNHLLIALTVDGFGSMVGDHPCPT